MPKTSRVNTPVEREDDVDMDNGHEDTQKAKRRTKPLVDQLHAQLIRNRMQRTQARDYSRILRDSNMPAQWYKSPPVSRSIYYYDQNQQRHAPAKPSSSSKEYSHLQLRPPPPPRPSVAQIPERPLNQLAHLQRNALVFTPRTKYMLDLYSTAVNYQQQQRQRSHTKDHSASSRHQPTSTTENRRPSRLETVPTLPTIVTSSYINDSSASSFDREQPAVLVSPTMDTTQTRSIEFLLLNNSTGRKLNPILIPSTS